MQVLSVTETVVEKIRNMITEGQLTPSTKLIEEDLCKKLEVSRTPLREAFRILQVERYLTHIPRFGVIVANFTIEEVIEVFDLRAILESEAAYRTAKFISNDSLEQMLFNHNQFKNNVIQNEKTFNEFDTNLHMQIAKCSQNNRLEETIINLWRQSTLPRRLPVLNKERVLEAFEEHSKIIKAIEEKNPDDAKKYMNEHFKNSLNRIIANKDKKYLL